MEIVAPLISFNWTLVMVLITFLILYLVVKKFFFDKIHSFMQAREQKVIDQFDNAEAAEKLANEHLAEYESKLEDVETERRGVLKEAKTLADKRAEKIIREAHERAEQIIRHAEKEREHERVVFAETMKDQVAMLAIYAAEKIIQKELDEETHAELLDEIIRENEKPWIH